MTPVRRVRVRIGQLLLQKGLITSEQLQEALSLQRSRERDKHLGQILVEFGYVNRDELYAALAIQSGYPYINIACCMIKPEVLSLVPEVMARKYQVLPIDKIQNILTVAMANPMDKLAIEQIEKLTDTRVLIFLTTPLELKEMFSLYYDKKEE